MGLTRRAVLAGGGVLAVGGAGAISQLRGRGGFEHVPLYADTLALTDQGGRELIPPGQAADLVVPNTRVLASASSRAALVAAEEQWLTECAAWTHTDKPTDPVRCALLDLRVLGLDLEATVAGWSPQWRYAWPRDGAFVAAALARAGRPTEAVAELAFYQSVQDPTGPLQARYDLPTRRRPDGRAAQLDGPAWLLWAAGQVAAAYPERAADLLAGLEQLLTRSTGYLVDGLDPDTGLPPVSADYWEVPEKELTLGIAAPVAAGLSSASQVLPLIDRSDLAARAAAAAQRLNEVTLARFGNSFARHVGDVGPDSAITFLAPPIAPQPVPAVSDALPGAFASLRQSAGGVTPGATWHREDGIAWTPETALFALAFAGSGQRQQAQGLLSWLASHRTAAGSYPEKVLATGAPAAVAPLAWTAALVVLIADQLRQG